MAGCLRARFSSNDHEKITSNRRRRRFSRCLGSKSLCAWSRTLCTACRTASQGLPPKFQAQNVRFGLRLRRMEPRAIRIAELLANEVSGGRVESSIGQATLATLVLSPKKASATATSTPENACGKSNSPLETGIFVAFRGRWCLPWVQNCTSAARASPVPGFGSRSSASICSICSEELVVRQGCKNGKDCFHCHLCSASEAEGIRRVSLSLKLPRGAAAEEAAGAGQADGPAATARLCSRLEVLTKAGLGSVSESESPKSSLSWGG